MIKISSILTLIGAALLLSSAAFAQTQCNFTTECFENEACAETAFTLSYDITACPRAPGPRGIIAETDFGQIRGQEIIASCGSAEQVSDSTAFVLHGDGATYLLSVSGSEARLTTHVDGPLSITYIGQCEVSE